MAKKTTDVGFNIKHFVKGSEEEKDMHVHDSGEVKALPATTGNNKIQVSGNKKNSTKASSNTPIPVQTSMSYIQENIPYANAYIDTNQQLDAAIQQLDMLGAEVMGQLQTVRENKTLRNKYNIINDMTMNATSVINAKIAAIREKNKTINDVNHLELSRMKELKFKGDEADDNAKIAQMYDAFINTPVGGGIQAFGAPTPMEMAIPGTNTGLNHVAIGGSQENWEAGLNPSQNRMLYEAKGLIDTVVFYDSATGNRWFEVVDKQTGQPMQGIEKPSNANIYDLDINIRGGFAKDSNRNISYPLVVINGQPADAIITQY